MDMKTTLKMAAGGVAFFSLGAFVTALAEGRVSIPVAGPSNRAQIEQVVHDYLIGHPEIMVEMSNKLDVQQASATDKLRKDALFAIGTAALTDPKVAYVAGPKDAKVTVAEFFDYRCPHCKASMAAVEGFPGARQITLIKTGDNSYCVVAEWESFNKIVDARPRMISLLDSFRD